MGHERFQHILYQYAPWSHNVVVLILNRLVLQVPVIYLWELFKCFFSKCATYSEVTPGPVSCTMCRNTSRCTTGKHGSNNLTVGDDLGQKAQKEGFTLQPQNAPYVSLKTFLRLFSILDNLLFLSSICYCFSVRTVLCPVPPPFL